MERNIKEILSHLTQTQVDDYDTWLRVGMALHADGQSCSVWDEWSRNSPKYENGACERHWKTFGKHSGVNVGIGSIVQMAKDNGYNPNRALSWNDEFGSREKGGVKLSPKEEFKKYISALFKTGDTINYVVDTFEKDGKYLPKGKGINSTYDELSEACDKFSDLGAVIGDWNENGGAFIRINPMSGEGCRNSDVADFRYCLIESDSMPKVEQLRKIREFNLPCAAIVDSGGKSVHAIVKIDAGINETLYRDRVATLIKFLDEHDFTVDKACRNPSRLSRLAGASRNGKRQSLIEVNCGAKSFQDWQENNNTIEINCNDYDDMMGADATDMSDCILGNRHLCKECPWLIVAASGVGKSVLAMQMCILFGSGRKLWGLDPHKPRSVVLIQAENNFLDLVEPAQSISRILKITSDEKELLRRNFKIVSDDSHSGESFVKLVDAVCKKYHPEILIIDPLMAYIGGDISKSEVCAKFFRNELNPIIHKHKVALIVLHHTGKPKAQELRKFAKNSDMEYLGIGSSDITNWARAISVILPSPDDENVFEFIHCKRGKRVGGETKIYLRQGESSQDIFWYQTQKPSKVVKNQKGDGKHNPNANPLYTKLKLETLSPMTKKELFEHIKDALAKLGEPCADTDVQRVFNNTRKTYMNFDEVSKLWVGKLYVSDSFAEKASEGGAE